MAGRQAQQTREVAQTVSRIGRVPLREVWKHEALDFTAWLRDNIDVLNEVLDVSLATAEKEQAAGDYSVELVAQDEAGEVVIIGRQPGRNRDCVETTSGGPLEWDQHETRRACVVRAQVTEGSYRDEDRWPEVHEAMIDAMVRLEAALRPHISAPKA